MVGTGPLRRGGTPVMMQSIQKTVGGLVMCWIAGTGCADAPADAPVRPEGSALSRSALTVGTAALVHDVRPPWATPPEFGSEPSGFIQAGNRFFFGASDLRHGRELWVSDGTQTGTRLLRDIHLGEHASDPAQFTVMDGILYFTAYDGWTRRLWRSDGTPGGTRLVSEQGPAAEAETSHAVLNGALYFSGGESLEVGLWKTDGTAAGTVQVKDLAPNGYSSVWGLQNVNGTLYFLGYEEAHGTELWKSDGTEAGTELVVDLTPGGDSSLLSNLVELDGTLFFRVWTQGNDAQLWKTDGTAAGTVKVKGGVPGGPNFHPEGFQRLGGALYFSAEDGASGRELWKTDGTEAGTVRVKDIAAGSASSMPRDLVELDGALYFIADDTTTGPQLWKTDGTEAGTVRVTDFPEYAMNGTRELVRLGSRLYFSVAGGAWPSPQELWSVGGTGSAPVRSFVWPHVYWGFSLYGSFALGDTLFFAANDGIHGLELWKTDGTLPGTALVADLNAPGSGSAPGFMVDVGGTVYFSASTADGIELWKTDGTGAGTVRVKGGFSPYLATARKVGNLLFFSPGNDEQLWKSDGTEAGTVRVKHIDSGSYYSPYVSNLTDVDGTLFFTATEGTSGTELWKSDGTEAGTVRVKDIWPGDTGSEPQRLVAVGGTLYFTAQDGVHGLELWKSDGTDAGTQLVADLVPGSANAWPLQLTVMNGTLYFTAYTEEAGTSVPALWKLDAAGGPPVRITVPSSLAEYYTAAELTAVGHTLFFVFDDWVAPELWKYDSLTGQASRVTLTPFSTLHHLVARGDEVCFAGRTAQYGRELWCSDGTEGGTRLVKDILPGKGGGVEFTSFLGLEEGLVFFRASDGVHGSEPWVSDGTAAGTRMVGDIAPGPGTSVPGAFTRSGNAVFFSADDGTHGVEPWRVSL
jgi:ELWxxDGT repeat protein